MIRMHNLEIHVSHACNLSCQQCSHFSNFKHKGSLSSLHADREMELWSGRLWPTYFALLGGEPTLNPELPQIVYLAKQHWPNSQILLVSNGFQLAAHPELPLALRRTGAILEISVHHGGEQYTRLIEPTRRLIDDWQDEHDIMVKWRPSATDWRKVYQGDGPDMRPYADGNPQQSWEKCRAKWCPQIHEGLLWKCPPLAYLRKQLDKMQLADRHEWQQYLAYRPLRPDASDQELADFVARRGEATCGMCPANPELFELVSPIRGSGRALASAPMSVAVAREPNE